MKKTCVSLILCLVLISCQNEIELNELSNYWEIKEVENPNGGVKKYTFNENIDFFEIQENIGIRKKVKPQLDGSFIVTNDFETFEIEELNGSYFLIFSTEYASWKEEIKTLNDEKLVLKNEDGLLYTYRKFDNTFKDLLKE
jgi:hypothetical protein